MKIMITGTRRGMTISQWATFGDIVGANLSTTEVNEFHDGDCVGADTQAHGTMRMLRDMGVPIIMHGHPCNLPGEVRAHNEYDVTHDVKPPLVRNRDMVRESDLVIAAPHEYVEQFRGSGTWATIRHARLREKHLVIVWPDGTLLEENAPEVAKASDT